MENLKLNGLVPLLVAGIGHCDIIINNKVVVKEKVEQFFDGLYKSYPNTLIYFMTGLAQGADIILRGMFLDFISDRNS